LLFPPKPILLKKLAARGFSLFQKTLPPFFGPGCGVLAFLTVLILRGFIFFRGPIVLVWCGAFKTSHLFSSKTLILLFLSTPPGPLPPFLLVPQGTKRLVLFFFSCVLVFFSHGLEFFTHQKPLSPPTQLKTFCSAFSFSPFLRRFCFLVCCYKTSRVNKPKPTLGRGPPPDPNPHIFSAPPFFSFNLPSLENFLTFFSGQCAPFFLSFLVYSTSWVSFPAPLFFLTQTPPWSLSLVFHQLFFTHNPSISNFFSLLMPMGAIVSPPRGNGVPLVTPLQPRWWPPAFSPPTFCFWFWGNTEDQYKS